MGKRYTDPANKPLLSDCGLDCGDVDVNIRKAYEAQRIVYALQIPPHILDDRPGYVKFYAFGASAKTALFKHNCEGFTHLNQGNKRKARYLQYTVEEINLFVRTFDNLKGQS